VNDRRREPKRSDERRQLGDQRSGGPPCLRFPGVVAFAHLAIYALVLMRWNENIWRTRIFAVFAPWSTGVACHEHGKRVERGSTWNALNIARCQMLLGLE